VAWAAVGAKAMCIFATALAVGFAIAARDLIGWLLGPRYASVYPSGTALLFGLLPMVIAQVGMVFSVVHKRPGRYVAGLCAALAAFLAASLVLVPLKAALGCALAMLLACFVLAVVMWLQFRRELTPSVVSAVKSLAPGLPFLGLAWVPGGVVVRLLLATGFLAAYGLLLFGARVVSPAELRGWFRTVRARPAGAAGP
jgi:hypothetical protein